MNNKSVIIRNCAGQNMLEKLCKAVGTTASPVGRYFIPEETDIDKIVSIGKSLKMYTRVSDLGDTVMLDMMRYREWRDKRNEGKESKGEG